MPVIRKIAIVALALASSSHAYAREWWYVFGNPDVSVMQFVDSDAIIRQGNTVRVDVLRIDPDGQQTKAVKRFACNGKTIAPDDGVLRDFACADADVRMRTALMLGSIAPDEAARTIASAAKPAVTASRS